MVAVLKVRRHGARKCRFRARDAATASRLISQTEVQNVIGPIVPKRL
jgi:hypothetical protein